MLSSPCDHAARFSALRGRTTIPQVRPSASIAYGPHHRVLQETYSARTAAAPLGDQESRSVWVGALSPLEAQSLSAQHTRAALATTQSGSD